MSEYLIIINNDDKIDFAQANSWEFDEYRILPDENGRPITTYSENGAIKWILENVRRDMISEDILGTDHVSIRLKYLKPSSLNDD